MSYVPQYPPAMPPPQEAYRSQPFQPPQVPIQPQPQPQPVAPQPIPPPQPVVDPAAQAPVAPPTQEQLQRRRMLAQSLGGAAPKNVGQAIESAGADIGEVLRARGGLFGGGRNSG